jgi:hypothetical protein
MARRSGPWGLSLEACRVSKVVSGPRLRPSLAVFITRPACVSICQGVQQISVVVLRRVWPVRIEGEPPAVVFWPEDCRHAVVNTPDKFVRRRGDDAEGSDPLAGGRVLPVFPKARETERRPILQGDGVGLLYLRAFDRHPLEEAVDRHDAAALAICLTEHRQPVDRLRVNHR